MNDTRKKIIESSKYLIANFGYAHLTLGTITKYMNISKGVIHYHFPQKDMVFEEIMNEYFQAIKEFKQLDIYSFVQAYFYFIKENQMFYLAVRDIYYNHRDEKGKLIYLTIDDQDIYDFSIYSIINAISYKIAVENKIDIDAMIQMTNEMIKRIKGGHEDESNN